jgi:transcriptional regulator with XRE-family HTH domain
MARNKKPVDIISDNIQLFRKSLRLSQRELADLTGVTQANVSQWESGDSTPPIRVIQIIKDKYPKVNAESFFTKPDSAKNFQEDSRDIQLKGIALENEVLRKQVSESEKEVIELRKELERLRDQIEVMTLLVRQKVLKQ